MKGSTQEENIGFQGSVIRTWIWIKQIGPCSRKNRYKHQVCSSKKHNPSCMFCFETTGWYECYRTDYNANVDIDKYC